MNVVVDASAAVEYLLRTPLGLRISTTLEASDLYAPELMDAEVLAVLRRLVLAGRLSEPRAREALEDLGSWSVERLSHRFLLINAWTRRENVSAYDALYVAAATAVGGSLLTADGPLSRAPKLGVTVHNVRE